MFWRSFRFDLARKAIFDSGVMGTGIGKRMGLSKCKGQPGCPSC